MGTPTAAELTLRIRSLYQEARAAWPSFLVPEETFVARALESLPASTESASALAAMHAGDFYLACACVLGQPVALGELDRIISATRPTLERLLGGSGLADDAEQTVRRKLATHLDGPARIAEYSGRGRLGRWIRAVATRVALDLKRANKQHDRLDENESDRFGIISSDPELSMIKRRDRPRFEAAFGRALASLDSRERNVLRLHIADGLTVDAVGRFYGVNKSTVSRWLTQARVKVLSHLKRSLEEEMSLHGRDLQSFIGLFESRLDLSISQFLARASP